MSKLKFKTANTKEAIKLMQEGYSFTLCHREDVTSPIEFHLSSRDDSEGYYLHTKVSNRLINEGIVQENNITGGDWRLNPRYL